MENKIVLDSCVFNKLFLQESETDNAIALINHLTAQAYKIFAPNLFYMKYWQLLKSVKLTHNRFMPLL